MLATIVGADCARHSALMEKIWRFRHEQFVERLGWEAIRRADGREIDQFDTDDAIHLPLIVGDKVVGYTRLLPTLAPHLLSDVYPHLMDGRDWPRGPRVYEWTRCIAEASDTKIGGVPISNALMTAVLEYALIAGIEQLIVQTHPKLVNLLIGTGWTVTPLAAPSVLDGSLIVPICAVPSARALVKHHELYNITGSLVDLERAHGNPFGPERLKRLAHVGELHGVVEYQRLAGE
ncbi:acyl-homoserine-lactone synthase [Peteryoungia ipomoeae]|uniref:Acyl-homoserine-lactone synthase n=1 Tax=Peteryoungia ipomoeae TaxID=1210932 RepID=A0A4S8P5B1_9HYPH|nr:acyl-homoserine-lactone synthase [Peteryoungia ipomoeae]THV25357.1 GNAT family N-acetyltransferase [Peteryoungia ipomoeae]